MNGLRALATLLRGVLLASLAGGMAGPALADSDDVDWQAAQADGSARAFQRYLERNPLGRYAGEAFVAVSKATARQEWNVPADTGGGAATRSAATAVAASLY